MFDAQNEIADADNYPNIRLMSVYQDYCMPQVTSPLDDLYNVAESWSVGSSKSVNLSWQISGVCWMTAKHIYDDVIKGAYPIGLVISDWGGTTVQAWAPSSVTEECVPNAAEATEYAKFRSNPDRVDAHGANADCSFNPNAVEVLYNTMIVPFKDMNFKAGFWYQGMLWMFFCA
jgi:hypothetical protein